MTRVLVSPGVPLSVSDFDPDEDILIFALPADPQGGLKHALSFRHVAQGGYFDVTLTHHASNQRFTVHLPGVRRLAMSSVAVLSLSDAETLSRAMHPEDSATLTGDGIYPARDATGPGVDPGQRRVRFLHDHDWRRSGPPQERFFDLSDAANELDITIRPDCGGPVYAIRLTEGRAPPPHDPAQGNTRSIGSSDVHHSIVLVQTAPGTPHLSNADLAGRFATGLGGSDFRAIAWIWLGNEGHYVDPGRGEKVRFGTVNRAPRLSIKGPIAGSVAITR